MTRGFAEAGQLPNGGAARRRQTNFFGGRLTVPVKILLWKGGTMRISTAERIMMAAVFFGVPVPPVVNAAIDEAQFVEATDDNGDPEIHCRGETWGSAWGDLNGDGGPDLWMTNHQYGPTTLLQNNLDGTFSDVLNQAVKNAADHFNDDTHSAAWVDIDGDGDDDLFEACEGGAQVLNKPIIRAAWRNNLFINNGGSLIENAREYELEDPRAVSRGALWLDFDEDGDIDLVVPAFNNTSRIFRQAGSGLFERVNEITGFGPITCDYAMASHLGPKGERLLVCGNRNRIEKIYSLEAVPFLDARPALGTSVYNSRLADIAIGDFDGDLRLDLFGGVSPNRNESMVVRTGFKKDRVHAQIVKGPLEQGFSFAATGAVQFTFDRSTDLAQIHLGSKSFQPPPSSDIGRYRHRVEFTLSPSDPSAVGIAQVRHSGIYIGFDSNTERWEVRVAGQASPRIYVVAQAAWVSEPAAIGPVRLDQGPLSAPGLFLGGSSGLTKRSMNATYPGISATAVSTLARSLVAGDFDNDMDLDLFVLAGGEVAGALNLFLENDGGGTFKPVSNAAGAIGNLSGKPDTVTTVDYDQDGFLDLFITNGGFPAPFGYWGRQQLFRNQGGSNNWIGVDLVGSERNTHGIGALVYANTPDRRRQIREQTNGEHRSSQDYRRLHIGLGSNTTVDLVVIWPSGAKSVFPSLLVNRVHRLEEGGGTR